MPRPTPEELMADPSTPYWARDVIKVALTKDPVDVVNTLFTLHEAFSERLERLLGRRT